MMFPEGYQKKKETGKKQYPKRTPPVPDDK